MELRQAKVLEDCRWCEYAEKCPKDDSCDFRKIPFEKDAIVDALRKEYVVVEVAKRSDDVKTMIDSLYAVQVFVEVLRVEFGMSQEELEETALGRKMSFVEKAKLMGKVLQMKKTRGKK